MNFHTFIMLLHGVLLKYGINADPDKVFDQLSFLQLIDTELGKKLPEIIKENE